MMEVRRGLQPSSSRVMDKAHSQFTSQICNTPGRPVAPTSMQPAMVDKVGPTCHRHRCLLARWTLLMPITAGPSLLLTCCIPPMHVAHVNQSITPLCHLSKDKWATDPRYMCASRTN